ncbi:MAG: energy transducer TonB [Hyphomicrobiaceae bacterium]
MACQATKSEDGEAASVADTAPSGPRGLARLSRLRGLDAGAEGSEPSGAVEAAASPDDGSREPASAALRPEGISLSLALQPLPSPPRSQAGRDDGSGSGFSVSAEPPTSDSGELTALEIPDLSRDSRKSRGQTFTTLTALAIATLAHCALIAAAVWSIERTAPLRLGAGGDDLAALSVEVVSIVRDWRARASLAPGVEAAAPDTALAAQLGGVEQAAPADAAEAASSTMALSEDRSSRDPRSAEPSIDEDRQPAVETRTAMNVAESDARNAEIAAAMETGRVHPVEPDRAAEQPTRETETAETPKTERHQTSEPAPQLASSASAANRIGGASSVSDEPDDEVREDATAAARLAAGARAEAYGAEIVRSLTSLQGHLERQSRQRRSTYRGRVEVRWTVAVNGRAEAIEIVASSGNPALDRIAVTDLAAFSFPAPPPELSPTFRTYRMPIVYR